MAEALDKVQTPQNFGVFGIYRFILATLVLIDHLGPAGLEYNGRYAVFGFFILSGYVVSYILSNDYLQKENGLGKYIVNRFLRIYPLYFVVFIASLALIFWYPGPSRAYRDSMMFPVTITDWLINITAIGITNFLGFTPCRKVDPAIWSLGIELLYWMIIPFCLVKPLARKIFAFTAITYTAVAIALSLHEPELFFPIRYYSPLAGALPFYLGLTIFELRKKGYTYPHWFKKWGAWGFFSCILMAAPFVMHDKLFFGFYLSAATNALFIYYLSSIEGKKIPVLWRWLDQKCGHITYPIFLIHLPVGLALILIFPALHAHSWPLFFAGLLASVIIGQCLHLAVENPVNRLRSRLK